MYALITGASSGMGYEMAKILANKGYDIIAVARRLDKLNKLKEDIKNSKVITISCDLSNIDNCYELFSTVSKYDIEVFINNAGFGHYGEFNVDNIDRNLDLIDVNTKSATLLFALFTDYFNKKNKGYILNVASAAAFSTGPLLGVYYASKSFLYKLTISTYEELRRKKSSVVVSVLCPGPVDTEFNDVANVGFSLKGQDKFYVSNYAIKKLFKKKLIIIPSKLIKIGKFFSRFVSEKQMAKFGYSFQHKKM